MLVACLFQRSTDFSLLLDLTQRMAQRIPTNATMQNSNFPRISSQCMCSLVHGSFKLPFDDCLVSDNDCVGNLFCKTSRAHSLGIACFIGYIEKTD